MTDIILFLAAATLPRPPCGVYNGDILIVILCLNFPLSLSLNEAVVTLCGFLRLTEDLRIFFMSYFVSFIASLCILWLWLAGPPLKTLEPLDARYERKVLPSYDYLFRKVF